MPTVTKQEIIKYKNLCQDIAKDYYLRHLASDDDYHLNQAKTYEAKVKRLEIKINEYAND